MSIAFLCVRVHNYISKAEHKARQKERGTVMETETATVTICTDLVERILDLVSQDMLTDEDTASILRLAEQMIERRREAP